MLGILMWLSILINEVAPAPSSGSEYVELYNPSDRIVDVGGWRIDDDTPGGTVTIIAAGTTIAPQQLIVIALKVLFSIIRVMRWYYLIVVGIKSIASTLAQ